MVGGDVEIIHRACEIEIGIRVEALDERNALMAQIALDLEIGIEGKCRITAVLKLASELAMQGRVREICDMRAHARDREPAARIGAFDQIAAAAPFRIGHHRLAADFVEGDVLRRVACRAGDRQSREHALRIARGPFQNLHAAHRTADHREELLDTKMIEQHRLCPYHVADGDDGKFQAPRLAGLRIGRARPRRAHAAADDIRANGEIAFGVDRPAGADQRLPPAIFLRDRVDARDMLVAGQRMTNEDRVGLVGIELAIGLVRDLERRERDAGIELERLVGAEMRDQRIPRMVRFARRRRLLRLAHLGTQIGLDHPCDPG